MANVDLKDLSEVAKALTKIDLGVVSLPSILLVDYYSCFIHPRTQMWFSSKISTFIYVL